MKRFISPSLDRVSIPERRDCNQNRVGQKRDFCYLDHFCSRSLSNAEPETNGNHIQWVLLLKGFGTVPKQIKQITNQSLNDLLTQLGFEKSEGTVKFHRAWRHPEIGTMLLLPSNKTNEPPLSADLLSVRTHLDANGHLEGSAFDEFVRTGKLTVNS